MSTTIQTAKPITSLNGAKYPKRLLFFDTESYIELGDKEEYHNLRLGVAIFIILSDEIKVEYREVYHYHSDIDFWNYVEQKTKRDTVLYIYAHNAKYDTLNVNIIQNLERLGYDTPYPTINNAFIVSASKGKKKLKIIDTFNYARTSVENLGSKLGVKKIKLDEYRDKSTKRIRYTDKENKFILGDIDFNKIPDEILFPYCERDVNIIELFMISLIRLLYNNGDILGELKYTTASTAMNIYRHKFISSKIYYHKNDDLLKLERAAYRGGIVECFKLHKLPKQKYYLLDINSMYVSVMSKYKMPTYPILFNNNPFIDDLINALENNYVIADVLLIVKTNMGKYGLKQNSKGFTLFNGELKKEINKLIFPVGEFRVTLHKAELIEAVKNNCIIKCFSYAVYHEDKCLDQYANYFSEMKIKAANKTDYDLYKLLGNGLYGKFGMRKYINDELEENVYTLGINIDTGEKLSKKQLEKLQYYKQDYINTSKGTYIGWNNKYIRTYTDDFIHVPRTNVALAGSVTAYARILLSSYIEIAGSEHIFYSDTDSLMVDETGYNRLKNYIDDKELGKLKRELEFNSGIIYAPKNYVFSLKKELKFTIGFCSKLNLSQKQELKNKNNKNILTIEQKSIILKKRTRSKGIPTGSILENGEYVYWRFTTFKEYLRSGGQLKGRRKLSRKNSLQYNKGYDTGYITKPFEMEYVYNEELKCYQNQIKKMKKLKTKQQKQKNNLIIVRS